VFYANRKSGEVILADFFPNLLARLPLEERTASDAAVIDHCLFRAVAGVETYCANIRRAGHGERLSIRLDTGIAGTLQFDRVDAPSKQDSVAAYVEGIDAALESVLTPLCSEVGTANLFSGGVDSTLIQSYLRERVPAVYVECGWNNDAYEREYGVQAARLLGTELREITFGHSLFLDDLTHTIKELGNPPRLLQWTFLRSTLEQSWDKLIIGVHADALFDESVRTARVASLFAFRPGQTVLDLAKPLLGLVSRLKGVRPAAAQLRRDPCDPYGYAGQADVITDPAWVAEAFGSEPVQESLENRLQQGIARAPAPRDNASTFSRHLELAHWGEYFCNEFPEEFRSLGLAHGKTVATPFHTFEVMAAAARIPTEHRYAEGLNSKYLLKKLLKNREPDYPINQRKGSSHAPFSDLYKDTTLSEVWERYDLSDWCEGDLKARATDPFYGLLRTAITWAVWEREVLRNPDLQVLATTREQSWTH
jgi:asparagine synthase (glutamine-hydrolysing)